MWRPYQILIPLLSLFLNRVDLTDLFPITYRVRLVRFVDADTAIVKLSNQTLKVRLAKIDAPERGQPFWNNQGDAGGAALGCALKMIGDKKFFLLKIFKQDMYGRILGDLDSVSLNLIENGCTTLYPYAEFSSKHEKWHYLRTLSSAKKERKGLWKKGGYQTPMYWRKMKKRVY